VGASGTSGFSGWSGQVGASGTSGFSGYSGQNGAQGTSGFSGISGWSGFSGAQGPTIYPGAGIAVSTGTGWGTSYGTSGANSVVLRDANQNVTANDFYEGFTNVAAAGTTTTLTASSTPNFVVTGSGGQTYQLPDATTLPAGAIYTFNNNQSSGTVVVKNNSGTTIATLQSGSYIEIILLTNSIAAGTWDYHNQAPSNASWSTNTLTWAGTYSGGTWNGNAVGATYGGTGQTSYVTGDILYASATNTLSKLSAGTNGYVLTLSGGVPTWAASTGGVTSFQTSLSGLTPNTSSTGAITLAGTLGVASGGTGATTLTGYVYGNGTGAMSASNTIPTTALSGTITNAQLANSTISGISLGGNLASLTAGTNITFSSGTTYNGSTAITINNSGVTSFSAGTTGFTPSTATSGAVTLAGTLATTNGGTGLTSFTANGVVYASSTSALATGSALTFDGTTLNVNSSGTPLNINRTGGATALIQLQTGGTINGYIGATTNVPFISYNASAAELMRLTTAGYLGIGTSSPSAPLTVVGSAGITVNEDGASTHVLSLRSNYAGTGPTINVTTNETLQFATNNTLQMYLNASGNLGLGVTPSAWYPSGYKAIQIGQGAIWSGTSLTSTTSALNIGWNYYVNSSGNFAYVNTTTASPASFLSFSSGQAQFYVSNGSGTGTFTPTQAMTLDNSGNLSVGTTTANNRFTVFGGSIPNPPTGGIGMSGGLTTGRFGTYDSGTLGIINCAADASSFEFIAGSSAGYYAGMSITGSNATLYQGTVRFATAGTERMRIDSSGNLLVGTTTAPNATFLSKSNFIGLQTSNPADSTKWRQIVFANNSTDATLYFPNGSNTATLTSAGAWTNASDSRQKTNIVDIKYGLNTVLTVQPHSYNRTDVSGDFIGFVAQELKTIIPEVVFGSEETSYSVDYGSLVAVAFKAIQELSAKVTALEAKLGK